MQFCTAQKVTTVGMYTTSVATLIHCILIYIFVSIMDLGFTGVALATSIHFFFRYVGSVIFVKYCGKFDETSHVPFFHVDTVSNVSD